VEESDYPMKLLREFLTVGFDFPRGVNFSSKVALFSLNKLDPELNSIAKCLPASGSGSASKK
jgi:hypothetical protein